MAVVYDQAAVARLGAAAVTAACDEGVVFVGRHAPPNRHVVVANPLPALFGGQARSAVIAFTVPVGPVGSELILGAGLLAIRAHLVRGVEP